MMSNVDQLLQQAITTAQAGDNAKAQQLFMQVVDVDERNELAWNWLASLVHNPEDKRVCLENVLAINPANEQAKRTLAALTSQATPAAPAPVAAAPPPPPPVPAPAAPALSASLAQAAAPAMGDTEDAYKCPRCGEPTTRRQSNCTSCRSNLMVSDPPIATIPIFVKVLGWLWIIGGALPILVALIVTFAIGYITSNLAAWVEYQQNPMAYAQEHARPNAEEPLNPQDYEPARLPEGFYVFAELLMAAQRAQAMDPNAEQVIPENPFNIPFTFYLLLLAPSFIYGGIKILIGMGIKGRKVWAYILNILEMLWNMSAVLVSVLTGGAVMGIIVSQAADQGIDLPPSVMQVLETVLVANTVIIAIPVVIQFLLTAMSYPTFFSTRRYRFAPSDTPNHTDHEHYRRGSYYGKKGLWAAAAHEWEMASKVNSNNPHYHHALGLAYTELHDYKKAMGEFQKALGMGGSKRELEPLIERVQEMEAGGI